MCEHIFARQIRQHGCRVEPFLVPERNLIVGRMAWLGLDLCKVLNVLPIFKLYMQLLEFAFVLFYNRMQPPINGLHWEQGVWGKCYPARNPHNPPGLATFSDLLIKIYINFCLPCKQAPCMHVTHILKKQLFSMLYITASLFQGFLSANLTFTVTFSSIDHKKWG